MSTILLSHKFKFKSESGKIKPENYTGEQAYSLSDGTIPEGSTLFIESIEFNGMALVNITATVSNKINSSLIIGEKTLNTLGKVEVNQKESTLSITK